MKGKKMMKKIKLLLIMALTGAMMLSGCGKKEETQIETIDRVGTYTGEYTELTITAEDTILENAKAESITVANETARASIAGEVNTITVAAANTEVTVEQTAKVEAVKVEQAAENTALTVNGTVAKVETQAATIVGGTGKVEAIEATKKELVTVAENSSAVNVGQIVENRNLGTTANQETAQQTQTPVQSTTTTQKQEETKPVTPPTVVDHTQSQSPAEEPKKEEEKKEEDKKEESKPSHTHSYTSQITTAATCEKEGVETFTCSGCGDSYTKPVAKTAHSFVDDQCEYCGAVNSVGKLNEIIKNASDSATIKLAAGTYKFPLSNEDAPMGNKEITFVSTENAVIDFTEMQIGYVDNMAGATLTFDGITVNWSDANEGYQGPKNAKEVTYKNCTINGTQFMYGDANFVNCTFNTVNSYAVYGRSAEKMTFTGCTFNTGGRAIMLYNDAPISVDITVENCVFNDDGNYSDKAKAAVETGDYGSASKFNITINNCTTNGFEENNSTSPLWGNKDNMPADRLSVMLDGAKVY